MHHVACIQVFVRPHKSPSVQSTQMAADSSLAFVCITELSNQLLSNYPKI